MRILTYNLHKGRSRRNESILHEAVHAVAERQPDLLMCQEVYHGIADDVAQSHFITARIGHEHVFGPNRSYATGCHGNATFARLPIAGHRNLDVSESSLEKRGILHVDLWDESRAVEVATLNTHFSLTSRQRRRQWFKLLQALPTDPQIPVIACGDFNDWTGSLDRMARRTGLLTNALWSLPRSQRRSFPAHRPLLGLDRVYVRGFTIEAVRVLSGDPWGRLSDHLPVEVELS